MRPAVDQHLRIFARQSAQPHFARTVGAVERNAGQPSQRVAKRLLVELQQLLGVDDLHRVGCVSFKPRRLLCRRFYAAHYGDRFYRYRPWLGLGFDRPLGLRRRISGQQRCRKQRH
ncbi:MAG: hypothetical protein U5O39_12525 [Gammaproteobacteria bacterium]|nr:hypothetical protein [Gammaproteobacteria bacterium]